MPGTGHKGSFKVWSCVVGGRRAAALALLLAGCVLLTACPPEGGDLVPLAQGEGASLVTSAFEGDTLAVTRAGVTLRARGHWSVPDGDTSVILEAVNSNAEAATIDFARGEMFTGDGRERLSLRSVSREAERGGPVFLPDKAAKVEGGREEKFVLEFKINSEDGRSGVPRNVLGQIMTLRLPVEIDSATPSTDSAVASRVDFVFGFKYAEYQRARSSLRARGGASKRASSSG